MKIIKAGKLKDKTHKTKCRECGTKFEFKESEGKFESDRDGDAITIECPTKGCNNKIWIAI